MKRIVLSVLALFVIIASASVAALPVPSEYDHIYYLKPDTISVLGYSDNTMVQLWFNTTKPFQRGEFNITYTCCCANVTADIDWGPEWEDVGAAWWNCGYLFGFFANEAPGMNPENLPPGEYLVGNITLYCCDETPPCETNLNFTKARLWEWIESEADWIEHDGTSDNATFTCGAPTEETFSKDLYEGWNLVSLPLTPSDNSANSVLASVWDNVSAVYRYNATSKQFESASTMDPGEGYFVHVTQNCTWTYNGTPCTSMSTELKQGLNMVGWLNCSKPIDDALSSIAGNYWYVARWNAVSQSFEVYNPVAPSSFNDFTAMDRGTGYFISAKAGTTLSASC